MIAQFIIPGEPGTKERPRVYRGVAFTPAKTKKAENHIQICFKEMVHGWTLTEKPLMMRIEFYFKMPESKSTKWKNENDNKYCPKHKDIDNLEKLVLDSLNGLAYKDDRQVVDLHSFKRWGKEGLTKVYMEEL